MLVEFRVKNYRSFRDENVLSLVASKDITLRETNAVSTQMKAAPWLLKSAVIYGPNASGKSNLVRALQFMQAVVVESAARIHPGQQLAVQNFRLDPESMAQPTEFEVTFIVDRVRYQYGFTLTPKRIVSEYLLVYKAFKPQKWFERWFDEATSSEHYEFGPGLKGPRSLWEGATRPNSIFLSTAVQLNSEMLRPVYDWFANRLIVYNEQSRLNPEISIQWLNRPGGREEILRFLESADISIADIAVETRQIPNETVHVDLLAGKTTVRREEMEERVIRVTHTTDKGKAVFDLMDESGGTRILLFLAAPILDILRKGLTLVVDEFDTSLHPLLVRELIRRFHQPEVNTGAGQLIFTTHDASLLDADNLLRRDQIWFVEKNRDQESKLFALVEFSPRKNEALGRGYLMGRYGGIPFFEQDLQEFH